MNNVSIKDIPKNELLAALYNNSKPLGLGMLHFDPTPMSLDDAQNMIEDLKKEGRDLFFDYVKGRVMKVDITGDEMKTWSYNRDIGEGAAERIVESLRK